MRSRRVWIGVLLVLAAGGLVLLDRRPLRLPAEGPRAEASRRWSDAGHGVLLLLDDGGGDDHDEDPSAEWENLLRQVFGGTDVLPASRLRDGDGLRLEERSLLVLPRRSLQTLPLSVRDRIDVHVQDGGLAVVTEAPDSAWAAHLGLRTAAVEWRDPLPWPLEPQRPSIDRPQLLPPPPTLTFRWTVWRYAPDPRARPRTLSTIRVAGRPAAWLRPVGAGAWSILGLDFGRLAHRLRQGGEESLAGVGPHPARLDARRQTNDLVLAPDLLRRDEPWLDAWVSALLRPALGAAPWPRLSAAPFAHDGWFLLGASGPPPGVGLPLTFHLPASATDLPSHPSDRDFGLLTAWPSPTTWREDPELRETFGLGPLRPVGRLPDPGRQKSRLESTLPSIGPVRLNHNRHSLWSKDPDLAFESLLAAGMRADTSFGPGDVGAGWAFGSAQPFRPLDRRGRVFDLWEIPYLASGPTSEIDPARLDLWLRRNRHGSRGPVLLQATPAADAGALADQLGERARVENHRVAPLSQLLDWWERREQTRLHWSWEDPTLHVRVAGAPIEPSDRVALLLPRTWHDRVLVSWSSAPPATSSRRVWAFDEALLAVEVPAAQTSMRVRYARTP